MGEISELEAARIDMNNAEDRLEEALERQRAAGSPIGKYLAARTVKRAGRNVYDSGEHLGMLEELAAYSSEKEG